MRSRRRRKSRRRKRMERREKEREKRKKVKVRKRMMIRARSQILSQLILSIRRFLRSRRRRKMRHREGRNQVRSRRRIRRRKRSLLKLKNQGMNLKRIGRKSRRNLQNPQLQKMSNQRNQFQSPSQEITLMMKLMTLMEFQRPRNLSDLMMGKIHLLLSKSQRTQILCSFKSKL